jgi:hypothetical protein
LRKPALLVVLVLAVTLRSGSALAAQHPLPAWAGSCGIPQTAPLWVDYGWSDSALTFAHPGGVVTSATAGLTAQLRGAGASVVYFDLYLKNRVGQPATPANPATIVDRANKLFDYAVQQVGCSTPTIVENELFGAGLVTPWSDTNAQYRQNVLTFLRQLASRGAHPVLLVNSVPYTAGDAGIWWQQVAAVADIVREDYVPATKIWKQGALVGNRTLRTAYRKSITDFTAIGIPAQRLGIMVSFSTTPGLGGRNGLEPASAWYEVGKWQALAAKAVAAELGVGSIWSWGWAQRTPAEQNADKATAACVWVWARDQSLCDAPAEAGAGFDASLDEGQIELPPGTQCLVGQRPLSAAAISSLQTLTGDRDTAYTAIYERVVESVTAPVSQDQVLAAERSVISTRFHGSRAAYLVALAQAHATVKQARDVLGDELRRAQVEARLTVAPPGPTEVQTFYESYPDLLVRRVSARTPVAWLGGRTSGLLISAIAPETLFSGGAQTLWTPSGKVSITPQAPAVPLGTVPLSEVRSAIVVALREFARGEAFERWSESRQNGALAATVCVRDELPAPGAVELTTYLPFLQL